MYLSLEVISSVEYLVFKADIRNCLESLNKFQIQRKSARYIFNN